MKLKYSILLIFSLAVMLFAVSAQAQEETPVIEGPEPFHRDLNFNEDRTLIYDHPSQTTIIRDSLHAVPRTINKVTKPESPKETPKERSEDDALSFNFLYYMIQKFKLSDLIDHQ